ncbi:MAG: hypothetical protein FD188_3572, partial [Ignavibacteria bacterium]
RSQILPIEYFASQLQRMQVTLLWFHRTTTIWNRRGAGWHFLNLIAANETLAVADQKSIIQWVE